MNDQKIIRGAKLILEGLGVDLKDHNFNTTPQRMLKVYKELFQPQPTEWPVFDEDYTDIVVMRGHSFYTLCPHHMLPVRLTCSVAYIPNGKVIGASKLVRMVHDCNRGPMTQEALTAAIVKSICKLTGGTSAGEAVFMRGNHGCFEIRGVRSGAQMITLKYQGVFETNQELRAQFLAAVGAA